MPEALVCENPECLTKFYPTRKWQRHCCEECRNHCTYHRVTLPKRIAKYEKLIATMNGNPKKSVRLGHTQDRVKEMKARIRKFTLGLKGK